MMDSSIMVQRYRGPGFHMLFEGIINTFNNSEPTLKTSSFSAAMGDVGSVRFE